MGWPSEYDDQKAGRRPDPESETHKPEPPPAEDGSCDCSSGDGGSDGGGNGGAVDNGGGLLDILTPIQLDVAQGDSLVDGSIGGLVDLDMANPLGDITGVADGLLCSVDELLGGIGGEDGLLGGLTPINVDVAGGENLLDIDAGDLDVAELSLSNGLVDDGSDCEYGADSSTAIALQSDLIGNVDVALGDLGLGSVDLPILDSVDFADAA